MIEQSSGLFKFVAGDMIRVNYDSQRNNTVTLGPAWRNVTCRKTAAQVNPAQLPVRFESTGTGKFATCQ